MRFVIAGSSGFLGTALRDRLARDGHQVTRLIRGEASAPSESSWDPSAGDIDDEVVAAADVVVNLAGAPIARWPWSESYKQTLLNSRVQTTQTVAAAIERTGAKATLVNGSGMNAYGHAGDQVCDESTPRGSGFLADVVEQWEGATEAAKTAGARVVWLRSGVVLHPDGGTLGLMKTPFRLGLGGRIGSGEQWFSTVSREDWVSAVVFLAGNPDANGPFNLVGPEPVTNAEFTKTLGEVLGRPTVIPVPSTPLRLVAGELSQELLGSLRVVPHALLDAGFTFAHPDVRASLLAGFNR
ncbi:MAG: TIGR01777 family protein [Nocardioidaceae bacterium]|nr:TIGR01777 family protein [Nocardioidaceae bacterium]